MKTLVIGGIVGFVASWATRAVFGSGRAAMVLLTARAYGALDTARRVASPEVDYFEDLFAEGKARWETMRPGRLEVSPAAPEP